MTLLENHQQKWGTFAPRGTNKLLRVLVRLGLGRGKIKKLFQKLWDYGEGEPVDIECLGLRFRCYLGSNNIENRIILSSKIRERQELQLLKTCLKDGGTFIDIGANIGYYSLMAAKFGATQVIAFEPNEVVRSRFEFNSLQNNFSNIIDIIPSALGEKNGQATLMIPTNDLGASSLVPNKILGKAVTVTVQRIDDVLREKNIESVDALKIDVEGFEFEVLSPLLECDVTLLPKLIIIEYVNSDSWREDIIAHLINKSYTILGKNRSNMFLSCLHQNKER